MSSLPRTILSLAISGEGTRMAEMGTSEVTRRAFLATTTTSALAALAGCTTRRTQHASCPERSSPNDRLNIAAIGAGAKSGTNRVLPKRKHRRTLRPRLEQRRRSVRTPPNARKFVDYRQMLDTMPEVDACIVSTPDHTHAPCRILRNENPVNTCTCRSRSPIPLPKRNSCSRPARRCGS